MHRIYVIDKIQKGLESAASGKTITAEERFSSMHQNLAPSGLLIFPAGQF
jgi:hypothetical protein